MDIDENNNATKFSKEEKYIILLTGGIAAIVAVIICFIALGMAIVLKLYKYAVHRLAMYQVMAALFYSVICVLELAFIKYNNEDQAYHSFCSAIGFLLEYAIFVKLMFTLCLTFHLFCFSVFHVNLNRLEVVHILVSVITPLFFVWIPFIHNNYGPAGPWCWIKNWKKDQANEKLQEGEIEQYALLYGPAISTLSLSVIAVIVIVVVLVRRAYGCCNYQSDDEFTPLHRREKYKKALKEVLPLVAYPILSFLLYIPAFINRLVGSLLSYVSLVSFLWGAVSLPLLSTFAGMTLIVHILMLCCPKQFQSTARQAPVNVTVGKGDVFTTDTVASTAAKTLWEPPPESETECN